MPELPDETPCNIALHWSDFPDRWHLADSFGAEEREQNLSCTAETFKHSVFVGGEIRVEPLKVRGKPIYIAAVGHWQFSDVQFGICVRKIVDAERRFWNGTSLTSSFCIFSTQQVNITPLEATFAHEYFHNWNPQKLGDPGPDDKLVYWFTEGFTDYFAHIFLLRTGLISLDQFATDFNTALREYYASPQREATNARIAKDFWSSDDISILPYRKGRVLAANWNAAIRSATGGRKGLAEVLQAMMRDAGGGNTKLTAQWVEAEVASVLGRPVASDVERYVDRGALVAPVPDVFGTSFRVVTRDLPVYELGFDWESFHNRRVQGVVEGTAAVSAGLRDGQEIVKTNGPHWGDTDHEIVMTVRDGGAERELRFLPVRAVRIATPQVEPIGKPSQVATDETLRWLGAIG